MLLFIFFFCNLWSTFPSIVLLDILWGLDPELSSYEAALALYEREVGPKPEKVCHFFFRTHDSKGMFEKT